MKSITVHGLEDRVAERLGEVAQRQGTSLNRTIKALLAEALGLTRLPAEVREESYRDLCGVWSKEEKAEFDATVADSRRIEPGDWE